MTPDGPELQGGNGVVLTVRFLCELGMLAGFAVWGLWIGDGMAGWALGVLMPAAAATIWGVFVAPKARWPAPVPIRLLIELTLFLAASVGLFLSEHAASAAVLASLGTVTSLHNATAEARDAP